MSSGVRLRVAGGNDTLVELESLWDWLRSDPGLRGLVQVARGSLAEGAMGIPDELLVMLSSSGGAAVVVALGRALRTWLEQRRSDISVTVTNGHGRSVTVSAQRVAGAEGILRSLLAPQEDDEVR